MTRLEDIVVQENYLIDAATGEKVIFYECDPNKNTECDHSMCRVEEAENDSGFGFCSKTLNPVLKTPDDDGEPYWGREYLEVT